MILKSISITNYKNIQNKKIQFSDNINCFIGDNGSGKTNIMDAIYYLCYGRSYFNRHELFSITHNEKYAYLKGSFLDDQQVEDIIDISIKLDSGKQIKRNGKIYKKISDYLGNFLAVMISPSDIDLINEGSTERRKFIDTMISIFNREYLENLINYNKILLQRNSLLKIFQEKKYFDEAQINIYDEKIYKLNDYIHLDRVNFLIEFVNIFKNIYSIISESKENVNITYQSNFSNSSLKSLKDSYQKDLISGNTSYGIHKDDFSFDIGSFNIKRYGSQGQQKSFLISLKMAKYLLILEKTNKKSILLLDDIFDKLDKKRINKILNIVRNEKFSQIFISDTDRKRTEEIVKNVSDDYKIILF